VSEEFKGVELEDKALAIKRSMSSRLKFPAQQHLYGCAVAVSTHKNRFMCGPFNITILTSDLYWNFKPQIFTDITMPAI
jgi:hypothetical protein